MSPTSGRLQGKTKFAKCTVTPSSACSRPSPPDLRNSDRTVAAAPVLARWLGISSKAVYNLAKAGVLVHVSGIISSSKKASAAIASTTGGPRCRARAPPQGKEVHRQPYEQFHHEQARPRIRIADARSRTDGEFPAAEGGSCGRGPERVVKTVRNLPFPLCRDQR